MSIFRFRQFSVSQEKGVMKIGTDSMILGASVPLPDSGMALDIGTGTGVLALMIAQRSDLRITAIEPDQKAFDLAVENFNNSPWPDRIKPEHTSLQEFITDQSFDLIISNPPFYKDNTQYQDAQRRSIRSTNQLSFDDLIEHVNRLITPQGIFYVILPVPESAMIDKISLQAGLKKVYLRKIRSYAGSDPVRLITGYSKTQQKLDMSELVIYKEQNRYSDEYKMLTVEFHLGTGTYFI